MDVKTVSENLYFADRHEAGHLLAEHLRPLGLQDVVVTGIPRGGVVVAAEVAQALSSPLDILLVRKLRAPYNPELAIGSLLEGGYRYHIVAVSAYCPPSG